MSRSFVCNIHTSVDPISRAQSEDTNMQIFKNLINDGAESLPKDAITEIKNLWTSKSKLELNEKGIINHKRGTNKRIQVQEKRRIKSFHCFDGKHSGIAKTVELIQNKFYWPYLFESVSKYVNNCHLCGRNKFPNKRTKVPIISIEFSEAFSKWHSDFIVPLPVTKNGSRYILIFVDRFTK